MQQEQATELAQLRREVQHLRRALWDVLVAVDELACVVEFAREQEVGTRPAVEAIKRARDILNREEASHPVRKTREAAP